MQLTSQAIESLINRCLFADDEPRDGAIKVAAIFNHYAFHPARIAESADEIGALLAELPDEFQATRGGGWSFVNACDDRAGRQWTGLHVTMEHLFALGIAAGKARWIQVPWPSLPGDMPYVSVN